MVALTSKAALSGSVLVRFLTTLEVSDTELSNENFAERMSRLIGLSDSINIAQAHRNVTHEAEAQAPELLVSIQRDFEAAKESAVELINRSFGQLDKPGRLKLPSLKFEAGVPDYEPFHRFYLGQQRELDYRILPLWSSIRENIAGASKEMAQLAAIDAALGESLVPHAKELFGVIPRLLKKRFVQLHQESSSGGDVPNAASNWIKTFTNEMQELLFAEMEVRLMPVIGLIEAVEYEVD